MILGSNEQLKKQLEYTRQKPDSHSLWFSKRQSGRDHTLEERYAIKFRSKLGKNARETYGKLQTAFRPSCINQASVFDWHKRFKKGKRPTLFKSGQWHFQQDNAPVHNSVLVTNYLTKMGIKAIPHPPYCPDLLPVTFGYSLSSEAVVMRQLRRWKRLWRRSLICSHKRTSMEPSRSCWNGTTRELQPEEITSKGTRALCVYYQ